MPGLKPERWFDASNKLFPHQVGFTGPPMDFDAAPSDFLRICPDSVGVHGRLLHAPGYEHQLAQRADAFHLLEEVVSCMANAGADVVGQVGTNWVHASGTDVHDIRAFTTEVSDKYETPFHMAGLTLVEACEAQGYERVALNSAYYWPDWRDGITRFLRSADIDVVWAGNFVDQGLFATQEEVNNCTWVFPDEMALQGCQRTLEEARKTGSEVDAVLVNGMSNYRDAGGIPRRILHHCVALEAELGVPVLASDTTLYWRIFQTLGIAPDGEHGSLLATL